MKSRGGRWIGCVAVIAAGLLVVWVLADGLAGTAAAGIGEPTADRAGTAVVTSRPQPSGTRSPSERGSAPSVPSSDGEPSATSNAGGPCTFDIECEDTDPCTADSCDFEPGAAPGSGMCVHPPVPAGQAGGCDDGLFCDGFEFCNAAGMCEPGLPATCCENEAGPEYCTETLGRCNEDSPNPDARCSADAACGSGKCIHCRPVCAADADCDDGLACNGIETCTDGECAAGIPLCGEGAVCSEKRCKHATTGANQAPLRACLSDGDCYTAGGYTCQPDAVCFLGRCCTDGSQPSCLHAKLTQSTACLGGSLNRNWYAGDFGQQSEYDWCGGTHPDFPGEELGCPRYGSGIAHATPSPPDRPVAAGPISRSPLSIEPPSGPGAPLYRLGDDYTVSNGAYLALAAFRFYGEISSAGSLVFEFWDGEGNRIDDVLTPVQPGRRVHVVYLDPVLPIPPSGYVTASVASGSPNAKFTWYSATTVTVGGNDPDKLFVNDGTGASNFMSPEPGILSFELLGKNAAEPVGACCLPDETCENTTSWACHGDRGHFQGNGNLCPQAACDTGACCDSATGACSLEAPETCAAPEAFRGSGSGCEPNCCLQPGSDPDCSDGACYTGADNCADALAHTIPTLNDGDSPYAVTITGDNTYATSTATEPDSCFGPADNLHDDAGWFEAFELTGSCTRLRVDFCCSQPRREFEHLYLYRNCACTEPIASIPDPYASSALAEGKGPPCCDDENHWATFGMLGPGSYKLAIPSALNDERGPYQVHLTADACPNAACCLPDGTCRDDLNQLGCDSLSGTFMAPPLLNALASECTPDTCTTGSCCIEDVGCEDEIDGVQIHKTDCDSLGGSFAGGVRCEGGTCQNDPDYSCNDDSDCAEVGWSCTADEAAKAQASPCPACEIKSPYSCQEWDNPSEGTRFNRIVSDLEFGSGIIAADDFIAGPALTQVESVCVWGLYESTDWEASDCADRVLTDRFRVRVLRTGALGLPDGGLPLGTASARGQRSLEGGVAYSAGSFSNLATYVYHLVLDTPINGLVPGQRYWIEVANDLPPELECRWLWAYLGYDASQGNNFSAVGSDVAGYPIGSETWDDLAFCISGIIDTPSEPVTPCCTCQGGCVQGTIGQCTAYNATAQPTIPSGSPSASEDTPCSGDPSPPNDNCAQAKEARVGQNYMANFCAGTDGYNPLPIEGITGSIYGDLWYEFTAPQDCTLRLDPCNNPPWFDSVIAVYSNGSGTCECPLDADVSARTLLDAGDESCHATADCCWHGFVQVPAVRGQCFLIRLGSWYPTNRGRLLFDISCGPPICGDGVVQASLGEECDGGDLAGCVPGSSCHPPGHPQQCRCAPLDECGSGVRTGSEQCDPGNPMNPPDDDACPGLCQGNCLCPSLCGDGVRHGPEECDGPADTSCGGVAGRCLSDCTCPPVVCGNNFKDPGEQCDGSDSIYCPDQVCRPPGDPAGECTCTCGAIPNPLGELLAEPGGVQKPRFFSFAVTDGVTDLRAVRVRLHSLHHPNNPPPNTPDFSAFEGEFRYVNSIPGAAEPLTCPDSMAEGTSYKCARLGCQPEYREWSADLAGQVLHVTGDAVNPSSVYTISLIGAACGASPGADTCTFASDPLVVTTARWGDMSGAGLGPPDGVANVLDIPAIVNKLKDVAGAFPEPRLWMKDRTPDPVSTAITVIDLSLTVDSLEKAYPAAYTIDSCP